ncbi:MAG: pyrroline-5-carboxylate reductase [Cyanobium sp. CACIAM 14]|nr:MAG: pyrroline-5-carboxylate reductase [Cyanobium sp. CACIAM 14]
MPWSEGLGVVGLGRMAQALLLPLLQAGLIDRTSVRAAVASEASARGLTEALGIEVSTEATRAWASPLVLLAVKPQQVETVAHTAAATLEDAQARAPGGRQPLLISVLAGVSLRRLQALFPGRACVRAVPNTPALVQAGLTGISWGDGVGADQREEVRQLFAQVGEVLDLPEAQLDPFLALTSSGPAFLALVAEAMADGAVAAGLPRSLAMHLTHRTLAGTAALLQGQELHPGQLKDMVTSPAGTTAAGLRELERAGVRSALIEAVLAAAERSRQLA